MAGEQTLSGRSLQLLQEEQDRKVWEEVVKPMLHHLKTFQRMLARVQHRLILARSAGNRRRVQALEMERDVLLRVIAQLSGPRTSAPCSTPRSDDPSSSSASRA
jgi:hypothetical protein